MINTDKANTVIDLRILRDEIPEHLQNSFWRSNNPLHGQVSLEEFNRLGEMYMCNVEGTLDAWNVRGLNKVVFSVPQEHADLPVNSDVELQISMMAHALERYRKGDGQAVRIDEPEKVAILDFG